MTTTIRENPRLVMGHIMRCLAAAKGDVELAAVIAEKTRAPEAAKMVLKSSVPAQAVGDVYSAADAPFIMAAQNWLPALAATGCFDRMAQDALPLPFRQRFGVATGTAEATVVDEGLAAPMQALKLSDLGDGMVPLKVQAMTVMTDELMRVASTAVVVERELRQGLALGTDRKFCASLVAATTPIASAGDAGGILQDIMALLDAVTLSAKSKPFFLFEMAIIKRMVMARNAGSVLFPDLTIAGGEINGVPTLPCDGLAAGTAVLVDASRLAVNTGGVGLSVARNASVELQTAPAEDSSHSTPASLVSLWQNNLVGLLAERTFAFEILDAAGVASLESVSY